MVAGIDTDGKSQAEELFAFHLDAHKVLYTREYRFHPERMWRSDFYIHGHMLLIEIEGGVWNRGKHGRGSGIVNDIEKQNAAVLLGFRPLRFTTDMVKSGIAIDLVTRATAKRSGG